MMLFWTLFTLCLLGILSALYYARRAAATAEVLRLLQASQQHDTEERQSEAQRAARDIKTFRLEYETVLDRCGEAVLVLNHTGMVERANGLASRLWGASAQALVGKPLLQATLSYELNTLFQTARADLSFQQREIRTPDAASRALVVSISPVVGETAERPRFVVVAQDVTELRRLETIRRDFVSNVSHELRTPLSSIRAMAETLQDGAKEDAAVADRFLDTIINETQRLARIAEDLLILSKAESRTPEKQRLNLSVLVEAVVNRFEQQAEKNRLSLDWQIAPGQEVLASRDQIEQVIINLVDNAIKYTPQGGSVQVRVQRQSDGILTSVSDTGIGIMSQDVPRIFERFYRVDKARSRQSGGTGLGLSIVKHIVESHGGQVQVTSEFNRGSTFSFLLPPPDRVPAVDASDALPLDALTDLAFERNPQGDAEA